MDEAELKVIMEKWRTYAASSIVPDTYTVNIDPSIIPSGVTNIPTAAGKNLRVDVVDTGSNTHGTTPEIKDLKTETLIDTLEKCKDKVISAENIDKIIDILRRAEESVAVTKNMAECAIDTEVGYGRADAIDLKMNIVTTLDSPLSTWLRKYRKI